jgi:hypothetical protein
MEAGQKGLSPFVLLFVMQSVSVFAGLDCFAALAMTGFWSRVETP